MPYALWMTQTSSIWRPSGAVVIFHPWSSVSSLLGDWELGEHAGRRRDGRGSDRAAWRGRWRRVHKWRRVQATEAFGHRTEKAGINTPRHSSNDWYQTVSKLFTSFFRLENSLYNFFCINNYINNFAWNWKPGAFCYSRRPLGIGNARIRLRFVYCRVQRQKSLDLPQKAPRRQEQQNSVASW
jgi:hypothetical protein